MRLHLAFDPILSRGHHVMVSNHLCHICHVNTGGWCVVNDRGRMHWYNVRTLAATIEMLRRYFADWDGGL